MLGGFEPRIKGILWSCSLGGGNVVGVMKTYSKVLKTPCNSCNCCVLKSEVASLLPSKEYNKTPKVKLYNSLSRLHKLMSCNWEKGNGAEDWVSLKVARSIENFIVSL